MGNERKLSLENIGGKVAARFRLDEQGNPTFLAEPSGKKNYFIDLYLESENPDLANVTYKLDSSYYDPIRESADKATAFKEEITSYGDYPVVVEAQVGRHLLAEKIKLSSLLEVGHKESRDKPEIFDAINTIKKY